MLSELTLCFPFRKIMSTALSRVIVWLQWQLEQNYSLLGFRMEGKQCINKYTWDSKCEGQSSSPVLSFNIWVT